jgi:hypothetical protein
MNHLSACEFTSVCFQFLDDFSILVLQSENDQYCTEFRLLTGIGSLPDTLNYFKRKGTQVTDVGRNCSSQQVAVFSLLAVVAVVVAVLLAAGLRQE